MDKKMLFIYNPMAGKEQIRNNLSDIIQVFCNAGFEITIFATQSTGDATRIVEKQGMDYNYVVCSGGDGTMNEVATVNDFASSLKIPRIMKDAAELITYGGIFECDMGKFNDKNFTYVAGFGAFTEVSYQTPQEWKNALGKAAYFVEALKHIADIKPHHMVIKSGDGIYEDTFILGLVSNSVSVAGFKAYSKKNIKMDDGKFEAIFIRNPKNPIEIQQVLNSLLSKQLDAPQILYLSSRHISIESDDDVQWTLDGEDGGICSYAEIEILEQALPIICDRCAYAEVSCKY